MKDELEKKLVEDFPQLFQDAGKSSRESNMAFGCDHRDGWHDLLRNLCEKIMATNPPPEMKFVQIKEKFGGIRTYTEGSTEEIYELIREAEAEAWKTCEQCGSKEDVTTGGRWWLRTLCGECASKQAEHDTTRADEMKKHREETTKRLAERKKHREEKNDNK